jgi:hypothetical protein
VFVQFLDIGVINGVVGGIFSAEELSEVGQGIVGQFSVLWENQENWFASFSSVFNVHWVSKLIARLMPDKFAYRQGSLETKFVFLIDVASHVQGYHLDFRKPDVLFPVDFCHQFVFRSHFVADKKFAIARIYRESFHEALVDGIGVVWTGTDCDYFGLNNCVQVRTYFGFHNTEFKGRAVGQRAFLQV